MKMIIQRLGDRIRSRKINAVSRRQIYGVTVTVLRSRCNKASQSIRNCVRDRRLPLLRAIARDTLLFREDDIKTPRKDNHPGRSINSSGNALQAGIDRNGQNNQIQAAVSIPNKSMHVPTIPQSTQVSPNLTESTPEYAPRQARSDLSYTDTTMLDPP